MGKDIITRGLDKFVLEFEVTNLIRIQKDSSLRIPSYSSQPQYIRHKLDNKN